VSVVDSSISTLVTLVMAGLDWPPGAETDPDVDCTADLNFLFVCDFRSLFKTQVNAGTKRQKEIISVVQYRPCLF